MDEPRKYRPSNGTEGDWFMAEWCGQCAAKNICNIWPRTMAYNVDDPDYPAQWVYDEEGAPICTSFAERGGAHRPKPCKATIDMFDKKLIAESER